MLEIEGARERLEELLRSVCQRPELPADVVEDLNQVYFALRNHVYFLDYQKTRLNELRVEFNAL